MRKLLIPMLILICASVFFVIYESINSKSRLALSENPDVAEREISREIPIDTPVDKAKSIMEGYGFECAFLKNENFTKFRYKLDPKTSGITGVEQISYKNLDFLYCEIRKGFFPTVWEVNLVSKQDKIAKVVVSTRYVSF